MVRENLEEILASARQMGFRTVLNRKGIGLKDRPDPMRLADVLVLSLDTLDPGILAGALLSVYTCLRGSNSFGSSTSR